MHLRFVIASTISVIIGTTAVVAAGDDGPRATDDLLSYRFELGDRRFEDLVRLKSGALQLGKVVEWADGVRIYRPDGSFAVVPVEDVEWVELRRQDRHSARPALPDLTIAFIERLPRDPSLHAGGEQAIDRPGPAGRELTWRAHVANLGTAPSKPVRWTAQVDETRLPAGGEIPALAPGESHVIELNYTPDADDRRMAFEIDPDRKQSEALRWNNRRAETIGALAVTFVIDTGVADALDGAMSLTDSFGAADYIRHHVECFNALLAASRHPSTPEGVTERIRCDRIVVEPSPSLDALRARFTTDDGRADYDGLVVIDRIAGMRPGDANFELSPLRVDWTILQRLGREIGLIDLGVLETDVSQCSLYDRFDRPAIVAHSLANGPTLMSRPGPFPLTDVEAAHLNRVRGMPRGLSGTFLNQVPESVAIEVVGIDGKPVPDVQIDIFQLQPASTGKPRLMGAGGADPLVSTQTDAAGRAALPNRPARAAGATPDGYKLHPNAFGAINQDGSNGLLLMRLRHGAREQFAFLSILDCNRAWLDGHRQAYVHRVETQFAPTDAPTAVRYAVAEMPDRSTEHPDMELAWPMPPGIAPRGIAEFRVYRKIGLGDLEQSPWRLVATVPRTPQAAAPNRQALEYFEDAVSGANANMDTHFVVTVVDGEGRESAPSEPAFLAHAKTGNKFAIRGAVAYMTLSGDGLPRMLYWDAVAGTQAYRPRTDRFPGYEPHYEGIAFRNSDLVVTDPVNHVLAIYDANTGRHELTATIPARNQWPGVPSFLDGEFHSPADVASDSRGNLYVADRGNHRVQILDNSGKFAGIVDPDFRFRAPHAVAVSFDKYLTVTDDDGKRVRVYELGDAAGGPKFVRQLPTVWDADRALATESGEVYVTGRLSEDGDWALLVFEPEGDGAKFRESITEGVMGKFHRPRGLYMHDGEDQRAYFMNSFPFDVRLVQIGK